MVCIYIRFTGHRFYRTSLRKAARLVEMGDAAYCPKHEWKYAGRHYI